MRCRANARGGVLAAGAALALGIIGCGTSHTTTNQPAGGASSGSATSPSSTASASTTTSSTSGVPAPGATSLNVVPRVATPTSTLHFSFRAPSAAGRRDKMIASYTLSVAGPDGAACVSASARSVPVARAGQRVQAAVVPGGPSHRWCLGRYSGRVEELARPACAQGQMCPQFVRILAVIGPVAFRVAG